MQDGTDVPLRPGRHLHVRGVVATWAVLLEGDTMVHDGGSSVLCCMTKRIMRWWGVASEM